MDFYRKQVMLVMQKKAVLIAQSPDKVRQAS